MIGGGSLRSTDIDKIIKAVKESYSFTTISQDRENAIRLALSHVGDGAYDMNHHGHGYLYAKCNGHDCKITDCSGWVSYIFLCANETNPRLSGVLATDGLSSGQPIWKDFNKYGWTTSQYGWWAVKPADAIIHFSGKTASEDTSHTGAHHALLYIGMLSAEKYPDGLELSNGQIMQPQQPITVECLTLNGKGNIYLTNCWNTGESFGADQFPTYASGSSTNKYVLHPDNILFIRPFDPN